MAPTSSVDPDLFGYHLEEQLRYLPAPAQKLIENVTFVVEGAPRGGPPRKADLYRSNAAGYSHLAQYWTAPAPVSTAGSSIVLYADEILAEGADPGQAIREVVLQSIEEMHQLPPGSLRRAESDSDDEDEGWDETESPSLALDEIAEAEVAALPTEQRDWFDDVEIAVTETPEADGDPLRLADFPGPDDDPRVLVLYERNIREQKDSAARVIRGILRVALTRRTTTR